MAKKSKQSVGNKTINQNDESPEKDSNKSPNIGLNIQNENNKTTPSKRQQQRQKTKKNKILLQQNLKKVRDGLADPDVVSIQSINQKLLAIESRTEPLTSTGKRRLKELQKLKRLADGSAINVSEKVDDKPYLSKSAKRRQRRGCTVIKEINDQKLQNTIWENDTKKCEERFKDISLKKSIAVKTLSNKKETAEKNGSGSDYEVEHTIKADKVVKKLTAKAGSDDESLEECEDDIKMEEDEIPVQQADEDFISIMSVEDDKYKKKLNLINKVENKDKPKTEVVTKSWRYMDNEIHKQADKLNQLTKKNNRYVVFVGNLPYTIDKPTLQAHFAKAGEIRDIRIISEKGSNKPKGFAYVEMVDPESFEKAFSLHHTMVGGRRINVLYTQSGHKSSAEIKKVVKAKNFKLSAMRKKGMLAGSIKPGQKRNERRKKAEAKKTEKDAA